MAPKKIKKSKADTEYYAASLTLKELSDKAIDEAKEPGSKVQNAILIENPKRLMNPILGPVFQSYPDEWVVFYPFLDGFKLTRDKALNFQTFETKALNTWPVVSKDWKRWYHRINSEPGRKEILDKTGLNHVLSLLRMGIPQNPKLIQAALVFWDPLFNCFRFNCGLMGPTVLDVAHITGLPVHGVQFDVTRDIKPPWDFSTSDLKEWGFEAFLATEAKKKGEVEDPEFFSFIIFSLCKLVLCHSGKRIMAECIPLAYAIFKGERFDFASYFLGHVYNSCCRSYEKGSKQHHGGPSWFIQLWLLAYFHELRATGQPFPTCIAQGTRLINFEPRSFLEYLEFFAGLPIHWEDERFYPFTDMEYTPKWLRSVLENTGSMSYQMPWYHILSSRELFIGYRKENRSKGILEVYNPNQFARQFGLTQGIPIPHLPSISSKNELRPSIGVEYMKSQVRRYVKMYKTFEPKEFVAKPGCTKEYKIWWENAISAYLKTPTHLPFELSRSIQPLQVNEKKKKKEKLIEDIPAQEDSLDEFLNESEEEQEEVNTSPGTTSNSLELDMTVDDPESTESEGN